MDKTISAFNTFKEKLIKSKGSVVITCPNYNFIYWGRKFVREILGEPLKYASNKYRFVYKDKIIYFVNTGEPDYPYRLRGLGDIEYINCDGTVTDAYWGISR